MTVAIVCSSLEQGRDGVGDYSALLAGGLVEAGANCRLIALHDPCVREPIEAGTHARFPTLRLPAHMPWADRFSLAHQFLTPLSPQWVSLQFVSYGWHRRGFVAGWGRRFDALAGAASRHLMVHEVWKGESVGAPLKWRALAAVQRAMIKRMIRRWRPRVVHTHTPVYAEMLASIGWRAKLLPLFSGVPVAPRDDAWIFGKLQTGGVTISPANRSEFWLVGFFASLHPEWEPEPLFATLRAAARTSGRRPILVSAGRMRGGEARWASMPMLYPDFTFIDLGALEPARVSQFLQSLDFAVATTSWKQMPKSSAGAAMLDHGLSLVVTRDDWRWRNGPNPDPPAHPRLIHAGPDLAQRLIRGLPREQPQSRLPEVAAKLLSDLSAT